MGHRGPRLARLREMSIAQILALPESDTTRSDVLGEPVSISVYRTRRTSGETLVVVQALHDRWFGITSEIEAAGFIVSDGGEKLEAPEEMLWDYA